MSVDSAMERALQALAKLGFSEYEARTYLAMLKSSPSTGYQLAKEAGVPRSMVYEALGRLTNRGAIMSHSSGDVTRYAPLPVRSLLDSMRHLYEDAIDMAYDALVQFEVRAPLDEVWSVEGHPAMLARAREMLSNATSEILISIGDAVLVELIPPLAEASNRGVLVRFLLLGDAEVPFGDVTRHPNAESAAQSMGGSLVIVTDNSLCLIGGSGSHESAIWTGSRHVVFITRQYILQEMFTQKVLERMRAQVESVLSPEDIKAMLGEPKLNPKPPTSQH